MNGAELTALLAPLTTTLEDGADEFRRLDAAVGDGDLGVTVAAGAAGGGAAPPPPPPAPPPGPRSGTPPPGGARRPP
ncbi:MAG: hypothetical protein JJT89_16770, partial [Nitriliruptoraceae bacterium]|nr:hypothetical protein [Nitriliruptoraceae bacterium]